ncbi:THO complex subunit 1 transcription elongation factor-domain-containing protein [Nemania sp. NC0429]|nr:THO complex subunit 1 transcription elongation factor-domain-containing protein [Nemania sp. NC0429]
MSPARLSEDEVPQVSAMTDLLNDALVHAHTVKPLPTIEPPLVKSHFDAFIARLPVIFPGLAPGSTSQARDSEKARLYAAVETAARKLFSSMVANTSIDSPHFVRVWNLFDFLSVLSDNEQCDPALLFWLVEELLDSQTVDGCRKVFDFLESRRERITAKNLKQKSLVILRSCNDLLRRLSRAEDAAFCGRVYIFMFQSIPPGDRSSVNLRGEYHVENVTAFEETPASLDDPAADKMDVDGEDDASKKEGKDAKPMAKAVSFEAKNKSESDKTSLDTDALYPVFWSLQHFFSQPTTLFDPAELTRFKSGIEATMNAFETVEKIQKTTKGPDESKSIPQKRKRAEVTEDLRSTNNNPKYLTSRELFELEISDLYFRRHILIQAFIILDFLLSLTPQARAKIANVQQNRSVVYADKNLGDDYAKWAKGMKERITAYIQAESDGFFFFRVVESVISRDKGWVRWKVENCPPIERPSVSPGEFNEAKASAKRLATSRRPKTGLNSLSLAFMDQKDSSLSLDRLKDPTRWKLPDLADFKNKIASDDLDLDFAQNEKEKTQLFESKASKTWRALRIARRSKLSTFDKIEDWKNVDAIFQELDAEETHQEQDASRGRLPENRTPIILFGPSGVGASTLISLLLDRQRGVFNKIIQHTTRSPREGEVNGQDFHFVDSKTFNTMLDGDYFLESSTRSDAQYGTSQKLVNAPEASDKVALIHLDRQSTQMAKDNGFAARVIFITPPSLEALEARVRKDGDLSEEEIQRRLKAAQEDIGQSNSGALYDRVIVNDDLETAYKALEELIYELPKANGVHEDEVADEDTTMKDELKDDDRT